MGVLNITPDSFSDGGDYLDTNAALTQARKYVNDGADILDLGAESSRPGAQSIPTEEEWGRLEPVLAAIKDANLEAQISVDTRKPEIMLRAAELGCHYINDINGAKDLDVLPKLAAMPGLNYIAMHMNGDPSTMQQTPLDGASAVDEVGQFFERTHHQLCRAGFEPQRIWLDPGIGFGKTDEANAKLLAHVGSWAKTYQVMVGVSRKSFIGRSLGIESPKDRDGPSKMLELGLVMMGAKMVRTHEVSNLSKLVRLL
jgi:dihydropteroate synthase